DGSAGRGLRRMIEWSAIAVLVVASASTTALRGLADPPDAKEDQPDRVARAGDPTLKPQAAANLFRRAAFDPKTVAMGETTDQRGGGGLVIRLGEILRQPEFAEAARSLDEAFNA